MDVDAAVADRLAALGLALPEPPAPAGAYQPGVIRGAVGWLSGQFPIGGGRPLMTGVIGRDLTLAQGRHAARLAGLNVLAQIQRLLGSFARLEGLLRVDGCVASAPGWFEQPAVLDSASELFIAALGPERGAHARSAIATPLLPMNLPVELVVTFAVRQ